MTKHRTARYPGAVVVLATRHEARRTYLPYAFAVLLGGGMFASCEAGDSGPNPLGGSADTEVAADTQEPADTAASGIHPDIGHPDRGGDVSGDDVLVGCVPQQLACVGSDVVICNAAGSDWNYFKSCPDTATCDDGECIDDSPPEGPEPPIVTDGIGHAVPGENAVDSPCDFCNLVVTYEVDEASLANAIWDPSADSTLIEAVHQGVRRWEAIADGNLLLQPVSSGGDIQLRFVGGQVCCPDCKSNYAGCSNVPGSCDGIRTGTRDIQLVGPSSGESMDADYVIPLVAHEVGHALGLHHTNGSCSTTPKPACPANDIMCCQLQQGTLFPTAGDEAEFLSVFGTCGSNCQGSASGSISQPLDGAVICGDGAVVSGVASDPDAIAWVSLTVDALQQPACKPKAFPETDGAKTMGFSIYVDFQACGLLPGEHTIALWVRDPCDGMKVDELTFLYEPICTEPCGNGICAADESPCNCSADCPGCCSAADCAPCASPCDGTTCDQGACLCLPNAGKNGASCGGGKVCENGACKFPDCDPPCGACKSCSNGGCATDHSQDGLSCGANMVCSNGNCIDDCQPNAVQQCSGGDLYWYDSCGAKGSLSKSCACGCSGSSCTTCCPNATKQCSGGDLYWYDSCGAKGSLFKSCACGCSGSSCTTCCPNSTKQCSGGDLYWYDSCGVKGSLSQSCACGCSGTSCNSDTSSLSPKCPASSAQASYTCTGGVVMSICGTLGSDGKLTVTAAKPDGSLLGAGEYAVRVFDKDDSSSNQCKKFNTLKAAKSLSQPASSVVFQKFDPLASCGTTKAYCVTKADGNDPAFWCSGVLKLNW